MCSKKEIKPPCGLPYGSLPCTFNSRKDALSSSGRTNSQTEPPLLVICLHNVLPLLKFLTTFQLVPWPRENGGGASTPSFSCSCSSFLFLMVLKICINVLRIYFYVVSSISRHLHFLLNRGNNFSPWSYSKPYYKTCQ